MDKKGCVIAGFSCGKIVRFDENDSVLLFESVFSNATVKSRPHALRRGQVVLGIGRIEWVRPCEED